MWVIHWGLLLRLHWKTWVCPSEGHVWRWNSCLGHRGSGSTRYSGKFVARPAGNIVLWKGMATSIGEYTPVFLPGKPHWQTSLVDHSPQGRKELDMTEVIPTCIDARLFFFACSNSAPLRVKHESGAVAWVVGSLMAPKVQGHGLPELQELWPSQSLFSRLW